MMMENAKSVSEVARLLQQSIRPLERCEEISLKSATGRICAEDMDSPMALPARNNAAVDGFAFHYHWAIANPEFIYDVVAEIRAGHPFDGAVLQGQAVAIYTGAIVPDGLDCIAMQENCIVESENKVKIAINAKQGLNIRKAGENLSKGEQIIRKGARISPAEIGQLSAIGKSKISCYLELSVGVLSTGDEVVDASDTSSNNSLNVGQLYDTNRPMLYSLICQDNHLCSDYGIVIDDKSSLQRAYEAALVDNDVVISSGGASQGIEDHTQEVLAALGFEVIFWRIAMKPGRPMAVGKRGNKLIICLPGNPVATFVCYRLIVAPLLDCLQSGSARHPLRIALPALFRHNKSVNRAEYLRAKLVRGDDGRTYIDLHGRKGAGVISSLTGADGLVEIPNENSGVEPGMILDFLPFMERCL
jgi:molybdopterin molybdotransferase